MTQNAPNAATLARMRRREARHLRRVERLDEAFDNADNVEAELRINKQIHHAAKMASKAVQRRMRYERLVSAGTKRRGDDNGS